MLIDCPYCKSRVDASLIGEHDEEFDPNQNFPTKIVFVECPACSRSLLGVTEAYPTGSETWDWGNPNRLWPEPESALHHSIPAEVRSSLEEARKCYQVRAFSACAVMCGKAIEEICVAHTSKKNLHGGLMALRDSGIIDGRLFDWSDSLRKERNISAHATGQKVTAADAQDVLEFATAICEYVYVLSDRYDRYQKRKAERERSGAEK